MFTGLLCWCSFKCRPSGSCPVVSARGQSSILAQCGVPELVAVIPAEFLPLAQFLCVGAQDRELKPCSLYLPHMGVPVALEGIQSLGRITTAVGWNEQGEHGVVAVLYSDGLNPDGGIAWELPHDGIVSVLGICIRGEHGVDFQRLVCIPDFCKPGIQTGTGGADGEVVPAWAEQSVQVVGCVAMATSSNFHDFVLSFVGRISLRPAVVWYAISIAPFGFFVKNFFRFFQIFFWLDRIFVLYRPPLRYAFIIKAVKPFVNTFLHVLQRFSVLHKRQACFAVQTVQIAQIPFDAI